jgi:hypothetical protein
MSDAGSEESAAAAQNGETPDLLVAGIQKAIGRPGKELTAATHASACRKLLRLRDMLRGGQTLSATAKMILACVGVVVHKRAAVMVPVSEDDKDETSVRLGEEYTTTALLIFVVLSLGMTAPNFSTFDLEQVVRRAEKCCLWALLRTGASDPTDATPPIWHGKQMDGMEMTLNAASPMMWNCEDDDDMGAGRDQTCDVLPPDYGVAQSCLALGSIQAQSPDAEDVVKRMRWLSAIFFRHTAQQLAARQLKQEDDNDFLSLSASAFASAATMGMGPSDSRIAAVVAAAESEAGQSVLRDLILSFMLPANIIGIRQTLLLSREAAHAATIEFAEEVQYGHEAAMAGAEYLMQNTNDELRLSCVLLAGLACLTTRDGADPIRKGNAFGGRVSLPFLETEPPSNPEAHRIALLPESRTWVLYKLGRGGKPQVVSSVSDYDGLRLAVAGLAAVL